MNAIPLKTDKMIARIEDGIGWMIFNHPERRNALNLAMRLAIPEILTEFQNNNDVRVVVMTGAGDKAFVSGADISEFDEMRATPEQCAEYNRQTERTNETFLALEKPLIAMIRGFCLGGGLATAIKADLRFASNDAEFGIPAARLGLGYAFEAVRNLADFVGPAYASEILFTGRRFSAEEAWRMGLVNRVVTAAELESVVKETAAMIAANAPLTVKAMKTNVREVRKDPDRRDLALCAARVEACFKSADYIEGRHAFLEKRKPQFQGR